MNMKKIFLTLTSLVSFTLFSQAPTIQWAKCFGGSNYESANSIVQTVDGGYIFAGHSRSTNGDVSANYGNNDYWIVKIDNTGEIEWEKNYGGTSDDQAKSIIQTNDGGYIVAGVSSSVNGDITNFRGDLDYWIVKLDAEGTIEWQRKYGGDDKETAYSITQTNEGGYIVAGRTYSYDGTIMPVNGDITNFNGGTDGWIVKLSAIGTIEWERCLGSNELDNFFSVKQTPDGGYIATGDLFFGGIWLVKLNSVGSIEWQSTYEDTGTAFNVELTSDGGYILVGDAMTQMFGTTGNNFCVIKVNNLGETQWRQDYGGAGFFDTARDIKQTPDGGYIVTGVTNSNYSGNIGYNNGGQDAWVLKISANGTIQWNRCHGGSQTDGFYEVKITNDNGYIFAGYTQSNNGNVSGNKGGTDVWIVKLNPDVLSISENEMNNFHFYPNPAKDFIQFTTAVESIEIVDYAGRIIVKKEINNNELDVSNLNKGMYIIKANSNGVESISKLIID